ncbi:hypothetical protein N182_18690 [Sinorhizobium sp. GL2]|nr:hypothetical protein N182_18690 [Sinorhizobium sp. GL2]
MSLYCEISKSTLDRFWRKVDKRDDGCWPWLGAISKNGYGSFKFLGSPESAHRMSFRIAYGRFPASDMLVRHSCDNRWCVNPAHLSEGTVADNSRDMVERGRSYRCDMTGERNHAAKLSKKDVAAIKIRIARGETNISIAEDYPVGHAMISKIRTGRFWRRA